MFLFIALINLKSCKKGVSFASFIINLKYDARKKNLKRLRKKNCIFSSYYNRQLFRTKPFRKEIIFFDPLYCTHYDVSIPNNSTHKNFLRKKKDFFHLKLICKINYRYLHNQYMCLM